MNKMKSVGIEIIDRKKCGRNVLYFLSNGNISTAAEIRKNEFEICCNKCNLWVNISFYSNLLKKIYICQSCVKLGNKNPFYGKSHSEEFKKQLSNDRKYKYLGCNNPFYGKTHSEKTKSEISKSLNGVYVGTKNPFYGKKHNEKTIEKLRIKSKQWLIDHPEQLKKMIYNSLKKQSSGFKSSIEKTIEEQLVASKVGFRYNKILHKKYQYDFVIGDDILLEVHGDYWHANPEIYGDGKRSLNLRQIFKIQRDHDKKIWAENHGFKIYYIWETDIKNKNFSVIERICNEIRIRRN